MINNFSIKRFNKIYNLDVIAVYRKGKNTKLTGDTIRLLIKNPSFSYIDGEYVLAMPTYPRDNFIKSGRCGVSGVKMSERPENIGDADVLMSVELDNNTLPATLKQRGRNYYLCEDKEKEPALELLANEIECFEYKDGTNDNC